MSFNDFFESGRNPKLASAGKTDVNGNPVDLPVVMIQGGTLTLDVSSVEIGEVVLKDGTTSNVATIDSSGRLSVFISGGAPDSLPLPAGASTAANQASALSSLGNITTAIGLQAKLSDTQPVSVAGSVAVTGPLTDTQLRASVVPVSLTSTTITGTVAVTQSGTWNIGSITALPVGHNIIDSGTLTSITNPVAVTESGTWTVGLNAGSAVIGHVIVDSGNITNITNAVAVTNAGLSNIDVALSTRLKAADTLAGVTTVGTVSTITGGNITANAGTNLNTSLLALASTQTDRSQFTKVTDGTRDGTVKAASTLPLATDTALVVTQRDAIPAGTNAIGNVTTVTTVTTVGTVSAITGGNITVNNGNLTSAVNVQDGGNSITVDGTFWQTTQPVSDANLELTQGAVGTSALGPVVMGIVLPTISGIPGTIGALPLTNDGRVAVKCNGDDLDFFGTENDIWTKSEFPSFGPDLF